MKKIQQGLIIVFLFFCSILPLHAESLEAVSVASNNVYLYNLDNDQVIYEKGGQDKIYPASLTKIMTLILAIENIENNQDTVVLSKDVFKGLYEAHASMAGFDVDEKVKLIDLFYGMFLPSGADATRAVAIEISGSEEAYVKLMNDKATELKMSGTNFINTSGLHDENHYSTLEDIAKLLKYSLKNELFKTIFTTKEYQVEKTNKHPEGLLFKSTLLTKISDSDETKILNDTIIGGKTGFTNPAGQCLASVAQKDGLTYMLITAKAAATLSSKPFHIYDAVKLYKSVFENYHNVQVLTKQEVLGEVKIKWNFSHSKYKMIAEDIQLILPKEVTKDQLTSIFEPAGKVIETPIAKDQFLATYKIGYKDQVIYQKDLIAQKEIKRNSFLHGIDTMFKFIQSNLLLFAIVIVLTPLALLVMLRQINLYRRKLKKRKKSLRSKRKYRL